MEAMDCSTNKTVNTSKLWRGTNISDICKGKGPWSFAVTPVSHSKYHWVLYEMPVTLQGPPKPHCSAQTHLWEDDYVRMPFSEKNFFPVTVDGVDVLKQRWHVISEALAKPIRSSYEFENTLNKYNTSLPKFEALHYFFNEVQDNDEAQMFFTHLLPEIIKLALRLPELVPSGVPLLKQRHNRSLSMSQLQIACLLANAFLCTFPWRKNTAGSYPGVNFVGLFSSFARPKRKQCICEKLKCICNYFRRVTQQEPRGVVTFERKFIPRSNIPRWDAVETNLGNTRIHITSTGTIEDNGQGFLQVDFANKNIGGGVLRYGCVQEEIRFVICPELIISRLFVEQLENCEAVIISGAERYSNYTGYGDTFEWESNFQDETPFDIYGRRRTTICVIDATKFNKPKEQFQSSLILRELNKAYVGFSTREKENLAPVATGNWGCGAFNGSKQLKTLIQLMACSAAGRDLVYYSFGDEELVENFYQLHMFLASNQITVQQVWRFLCQFTTANLDQEKLYSFIQQAYFDSKKQPTISKFFTKKTEACEKSKSSKETPSTSTKEKMEMIQSEPTLPKKTKIDESVENYVIDETPPSSSSEEIIPSSQPEFESVQNRLSQGASLKFTKFKRSQEEIEENLPNTDISAIFDLLDGNANQTSTSHKESKCNDEKSNDLSYLAVFDEFHIEKTENSCLKTEESTNSHTNTLLDNGDKIESKSTPKETVINIEENLMDVDDIMDVQRKMSKKKITDYFSKSNN